MPRQNSYREYLKQDLGSAVEALDLSDLQKHFLRSRWLDQILWMEGRADFSRDRYYTMRRIAIIGGALVPLVVSWNFSGDLDTFRRVFASVLGLLISLSAALEEFFHYGERWRNYRHTVELLKSEGWQFFQLSGPYREYESHAKAYPVFAAQVENFIRQDVEVYITKVVREKKPEKSELQNPES